MRDSTNGQVMPITVKGNERKMLLSIQKEIAIMLGSDNFVSRVRPSNKRATFIRRGLVFARIEQTLTRHEATLDKRAM